MKLPIADCPSAEPRFDYSQDEQDKRIAECAVNTEQTRKGK
jgi:hypothetical protein